MSDLYEFQDLKAYLLSQGFNVKAGEGYKIIREDFNVAYKEGKIEFNADGIYFQDEEGRQHKGYIFQPKYRVNDFGFPKFHLFKCKTIETFLQKKIFDQYYLYSTANVNDIIERNTDEVFKDVSLCLCENCRRILRMMQQEEFENTEDFYNVMGGGNTMEGDLEVDLFGYVREWRRISAFYRKKKNYTCEKCGIRLDGINKRFLEVHHIDGDKLHNSENNLKCLCIECHSNVDEFHKRNYESRANQIRLKKFFELKSAYHFRD